MTDQLHLLTPTTPVLFDCHSWHSTDRALVTDGEAAAVPKLAMTVCASTVARLPSRERLTSLPSYDIEG